MAFMIPVVKKDYNLYGSSCPSRGSTPKTSLSSTPRGFSLSGSPSAASSFVGSPRNSQPHNSFSKSESQSSLHKFHSKVLDRLKSSFRGKDGDSR